MSAPNTAMARPKDSPNLLTCIASDQWKQEVTKVLPKDITLEAVLRVARSVASEARFAQCEPRSFLLALLKCARAGLYPDGREAHLIPFGKEVQAIFDWKGLVALANRAGYLVTPKLVHENDVFEVDEDDGSGQTKVLHKADYRKPRGEVQAVYSRVVRPDGRVDYEIMTAEEVEQTRKQYSRAKDSSAWKNSWPEMAKKVCVKRHSKRWDLSPEIRQAINADDDAPVFNEPPKPTKPIFSKPAQPAAQLEMPAIPAQESEPDAESESPLAKVKSLCAEAKTPESTLIEFLSVIGLANDGENLSTVGDDALAMVISQWPEFSARINEVKQ